MVLNNQVRFKRYCNTGTEQCKGVLKPPTFSLEASSVFLGRVLLSCSLSRGGSPKRDWADGLGPSAGEVVVVTAGLPVCIQMQTIQKLF